MKQNPIVSIQKVSKAFGKHLILKDISLDIHNGEIFGLLGPSGAGKTTLVKQLAGLDIPTKGMKLYFSRTNAELKINEKNWLYGAVRCALWRTNC